MNKIDPTGLALADIGVVLITPCGPRNCPTSYQTAVDSENLKGLRTQRDLLNRINGQKGIVFVRQFGEGINRFDHIDLWNGSTMAKVLTIISLGIQAISYSGQSIDRRAQEV